MPKIKPSLLTMQDNPVELCCFEIFWEAVKAGDLIAIDQLNFTEDHLKAKNAEGMNALMLAVIEQKEDMVRWLLLQRSPLEDQAIYDWRALHLAAQRTSYAILRDLLLAGAKGLVHDQAGWTPLHIAVSKGNIPFMQLLIMKFPQLVYQADFQGWTPLHIAASGQNEEVLKLLVKEGAKLEALTFHDETPFDIANKYHPQPNIATWLIETQQRQQQLKQFLEHENLIGSLKLQNEQLRSEVIEQRAVIAHLKAILTNMDQEANTLKDKVVNRLTLFKSQPHLFQQDNRLCSKNEEKKEETVNPVTAQDEMDIGGQSEKADSPQSPSMLLL